MKLNYLFCLFLFFSFVSADSAFATVLAKINDKSITLEEFNKTYDENKKLFSFNAPSKKNMLDDLIKRELGVQEAKKLGLDRDPDIVNRMNTVLFHAFLEKKLGKKFEKIFVSTNDAKSYYQKSPDVRTSHIFVPLSANASKADQKVGFEKIKYIQDEHLKAGKLSFAEIAQKFSEGPSAAMGGDLDFQSRTQLDSKYYDTAVKLKKAGRVSKIIRTRFGYHIIRLAAIKPWHDVDQPRIKREVFEKKRQAIFESYMSRLRKKSNVSVNLSLIK